MSSAICIILILFFFFFFFFYIPISLLEKKNCLILGFHDERDWVLMVSILLKYIYIYIYIFKIDLSWAFDHVCYKLFYGCLSLDCRNDTLNMFAIMYDN